MRFRLSFAALVGLSEFMWFAFLGWHSCISSSQWLVSLLNCSSNIQTNWFCPLQFIAWNYNQTCAFYLIQLKILGLGKKNLDVKYFSSEKNENVMQFTRERSSITVENLPKKKNCKHWIYRKDIYFSANELQQQVILNYPRRFSSNSCFSCCRCCWYFCLNWNTSIHVLSKKRLKLYSNPRNGKKATNLHTHYETSIKANYWSFVVEWDRPKLSILVALRWHKVKFWKSHNM